MRPSSVLLTATASLLALAATSARAADAASDVVVGGHTHSLLSNTDPKAEGPYPTMIDNPDGYKVPVTQAASYSK